MLHAAARALLCLDEQCGHSAGATARAHHLHSFSSCHTCSRWGSWQPSPRLVLCSLASAPDSDEGPLAHGAGCQAGKCACTHARTHTHHDLHVLIVGPACRLRQYPPARPPFRSEGSLLDSETLSTAQNSGSTGAGPGPGPGPGPSSGGDALPEGEVRVAITANGKAAQCLDYAPGSPGGWTNDSSPGWSGTGSASPDVLDVQVSWRAELACWRAWRASPRACHRAASAVAELCARARAHGRHGAAVSGAPQSGGVC